MSSNFNSNFGGVGQEPSPNAISTPKAKGDFNSTFSGKAQDISRHSIPPHGRIGVDLSNNIPIRGHPFGAVPTAQVVTPQGGGAATTYPFTCKISGTTLRLTPGTVNSLVPSNMTSSFIISTSGTFYVMLDCNAVNAAITAAAIAVYSIPPVAIPSLIAQPPTTFSVCLAVIVNGVAYRSIGNGSVSANAYEVARFAKPMPSPDAMPYDSYFSWRIGVM